MAQREHSAETAQDFALAGARQGILVVDARIMHVDQHVAGGQRIKRYLLNAASVTLRVVVDAVAFEYLVQAGSIMSSNEKTCIAAG